ncbi:MAG: 2-C-methyl-D-erythritol 4-phosphate cytidylyltransferase [Sphingobacterium hotanense]
MNQNFVIIVAAGSGSRMSSDLPKQYMLLATKPILMHTIAKFAEANIQAKIILVISENMQTFWKEQCKEYSFEIPHQICYGGASRFQSVRNGLRYIQNSYQLTPGDVIGVHDAARPLVSQTLIENLYQACCTENPAIIPAVQSSNSVRLGNLKESKAIDRDQVWLVQTPQVFEACLFQEAYKQQEESTFTDDASVIEKMSNGLTIYPGDHKNIKITFKEDIAIAQYYLNNTI